MIYGRFNLQSTDLFASIANGRGFFWFELITYEVDKKRRKMCLGQP